MQDEEIDKLITDAANQHHPPYDDTAWGKMEDLLNQHLPQKKDKRRYVLLLLLFLLLGSAITVAILQPWKNKTATTDNNSSIAKTDAVPLTTGATDNTVNVTPPQLPGNAVNTGTQVDQPNNITAVTGNDINATKSKVVTPASKVDTQNNTDKTVAVNKSIVYKSKGKVRVKIKNAAAEDDIAVIETVNPDELNKMIVGKTDVAATPSLNNADTTQQQTAAPKQDDITATKVTEVKKDSTKNNTATAAKTKKKTDKSFRNNFAITLSAGADLSYVELSNTGKWQFAYGGGLTYSLTKHLRVGAGLYVAKKVYTASPYQYKFPGGASYPNLKSVNADCNVYEIPLTLAYNFNSVKKHSWFTAGSISSLLMKKEYYNYYYQTPSGVSYSYAKTINNENEHYFSVLTLSGGYQYNVTNKVSFLAEPYLKLPLSGIGAGKIKLNSTGLLFTAVIKPFAKAKK